MRHTRTNGAISKWRGEILGRTSASTASPSTISAGIAAAHARDLLPSTRPRRLQ